MHEKINTPINPCENSAGYVFQNCIYSQIMSKIGCQPFWMDYVKTDLPNCTNASQINLFLSSFTELNSISSEAELIEEYNCLKPCKYMEYKVRTARYIIFHLALITILRSLRNLFHGLRWMRKDLHVSG